jgi:hypothetical protein
MPAVMNQAAVEFLQEFRLYIHKLECATPSFRDGEAAVARPDAAMDAARNALAALEGFLQVPTRAE